MPIYEYLCGKCKMKFEQLLRSNATVTCPECGNPKVEKQFSTFAALSGAKRDLSMCDGCEPGMETPPCQLGRGGRCGME